MDNLYHKLHLFQLITNWIQIRYIFRLISLLAKRGLFMLYNILLVEDDKQIREIIVDYFTSKEDTSFSVSVAEDGQIAEDLIEDNEYDLILLDVMLPKVDGFSICRYIRKKSDIPIIFLTARTREEDLLYGYELGCDDYVTKPFSLAELYAKSQALLKRAKGTVLSQVINCGDISVNLLSLDVTVAGQSITLAPKELELLSYLIAHKNWVVTREILLERIWGYDYEGGDRVVDNHIKKLRKSLGASGKQIKTVFSKGYKICE